MSLLRFIVLAAIVIAVLPILLAIAAVEWAATFVAENWFLFPIAFAVIAVITLVGYLVEHVRRNRGIDFDTGLSVDPETGQLVKPPES
jgi:hypothetical protein